MRSIRIRKAIAFLLTLFILTPMFSSVNIAFADDSDATKGNAISVTDEVTGVTYNYVNFNGYQLVHPYMGLEAWTSDGKMFLCGVNNKILNPDSTDSNDNHHGKLYLYNTETDEFIKIADKAVVGTSVVGVIGADDCVYYSTGTAVNKYDIATKKNTVIIPSSYGFYPQALTVSDDCNYIAFSSNNSNNYLWYDDTVETGIFRYNIAEDKIEHYAYGFDYSDYLNHHQMNPANPDIVFFAHDGLIGTDEGEIADYTYLYDREWTVDFSTGEFKNVFKQGRVLNEDTNAYQSVLFTTHESWSSSGDYLYMNCYSNRSATDKAKCIIRCRPDGSHREFLRGADTGDISVDHAMATSDDKFTVVDSGKYVYLLNNDTYQQMPIYYSETSRYDPDTGEARNHPYHPHPNVARNNYKVLWGIEHGGWGADDGGVVGVAWYDFTELAESGSAKGGRYPVNQYIDRVSYDGLDCESEEVYFNGYDAIHAEAGNYIYLDISDAVVDGTNESVTVTFDYYDNGEYNGIALWFTDNDTIDITYTGGAAGETDDPYGNDLATPEDTTVTIDREGEKKWIEYTLTISGNFENINPYRTDLKIGADKTEVYIKNVQISSAPADSEIYAGGDGSKENPYQIANAEQLIYFTNSVRTTTDKAAVDSNISYAATQTADTSVTTTYTPERYHVFTDKYFELTSDISLSGKTWTPIGNLTNVFNGHFNGNGHTISNVYIDGTAPAEFERYAFFGATGADAEIKNLGIENLTCKFKGSNNTYTTLINSTEYTYTDRLVGVAGFVSTYAGGTFTNCYLKDAEVRDIAQQMGSGGTGAFFGLGYGTVEATETNGYNAMTVTNCYVNGATLRSHSGSYGFIGQNVMPNSQSELDATHQYRVTKTITNCYTANISRGYYDEASLGNATESKCYDGTMYPFAATTRNMTFSDCYTTSAGEYTIASTEDDANFTYTTGVASDKALTVTDIDTLKSGLIDNTNYYADVLNVNGDYPILVDMSGLVEWDTATDKKPAGKGKEEEPYLIATKEELAWAKNSVNTISDEGVANGYESKAGDHFKLISDIDLEGAEWEPIGNTQVEFNGTFDGNGHVISNFKISSKESNFEYALKTSDATEQSSYCTDKLYKYTGFFGRTGTGSVVKNLGIEDAQIKFYNHDYYYQFETDDNGVLTESGSAHLRSLHNGGMVGYAGGEFINCYVRNSIVKNMLRYNNDGGVGGFVGTAAATASFTGCYVKDVELCASYITRIAGFANRIEDSKTVLKDCYVANTVEERAYATQSSYETTAYGFAYGTKGADLTRGYSTMKDFAATTTVSEAYNASYSLGKVSTSDDAVTLEEIVAAIVGNSNMIDDTDSFNDGYPVCEWQYIPFKNYSFYTTKDGTQTQWFTASGVIDTVSLYKNRDGSDCWLYTVLYDKYNSDRMIACSIDFIDDSELAAKATHTITLTTPIEIPQDETKRYILKMIFVEDESTFAPVCDNFTYSE